MLSIENYGIRLRQIDKKDIEQLRLWRNSPHISRYMIFRDHITQEMQEKWYEEVCRKGDIYFLIFAAGMKIGVCNFKDIDLSERLAEFGIYIADETIENPFIPYAAALLLLDFGFKVIGLEKIIAHVLNDNDRAIRFDTSLGFVKTELISEKETGLYLLGPDNYFQATANIRRIMKSNSRD